MRLHVEERGRGGPGLVLLHGYLASTAIWGASYYALAEFSRVVAIDAPGAGYSDRPRGAPYDLPWMARRLRDALDALELERPVLVGHSLGGALALHTAALFPDRVAGLVLVSPFVYAPPPPPGLRIARLLPGPMRCFFKSALGRSMIAGMVRRSVYSQDNGDLVSKATARQLLGHLDAPGGWEAATRMGLAAHTHCPDSSMIRQIDKACLVVWGAEDLAHSPDLGKRLVAELPGPARLEIFQQAAHNCHEEQPEAFADEVQAYLKSLDETMPGGA